MTLREKLTPKQIERAARALYRYAGWDRPWPKIDPAGRRRFREAIRIVVRSIQSR